MERFLICSFDGRPAVAEQACSLSAKCAAILFSTCNSAPRAGRVQKHQARRQRDSVSHRDMQLTASQAAPVARAAQGSPLTAPPPPLPSMPRLPPLRSKVWLRQAMAVVAPPPRVIAEARRSSALEELQQLRREEAQADEDAAAPSGGPYPFSSNNLRLNLLKAGGMMYMLRGRRSRHESIEVTKFGAVNCSQLSIYAHAKTHRCHSIKMNIIFKIYISRLEHRMWGRPHLQPPHCGRRAAALLACPVGRCGSPIEKGLIHIGWLALDVLQWGLQWTACSGAAR